MQVGHDRVAGDPCDAADLDLLPDRRVRLVEDDLDRLSVEPAGQQGSRVRRADGDRVVEHAGGQRDEPVALGDEVGLAVELEQGADAVPGDRGDQALSLIHI